MLAMARSTQELNVTRSSVLGGVVTEGTGGGRGGGGGGGAGRHSGGL